ncbi:MBL fold metallo-hydrolase [Agrococcus sp. BE272]|uniref:MBL fold metallo-hydrolase n=1 Tax=Agrococcus sp. BE272 TaxID=2817727 RepID=UPI0028642B8D|nr:MBL fold metallo-hydrolase [Agrococcus sp. BE272]MDR7233914.1 glyoxylase-like metal-dependent hydrolase (beta-lactamase superfamily II) [Agrococcus sp. BE272]
MVEIERILAPNPGPMTLEGTNTYVIGGEIVVDPGPADVDHVERLVAVQPRLILVTHKHTDHTEAATELARSTGAVLRGLDPDECYGGEPLTDGEWIPVGDVELQILATPGHTHDSISIVVPGRAVLTGDTILGRGSTVIMHPDGAIAPYLATLDRLEALGDLHVLPGHGEPLPSVAAVAREYRAHRLDRLDQVRAALRQLGTTAAEASVGEVTDLVYADADASVRQAAEASAAAQLSYLEQTEA